MVSIATIQHCRLVWKKLKVIYKQMSKAVFQKNFISGKWNLNSI
jgi:hypothetical protein